MALILLNRSSILKRSANVAGMSFIDFMRFNEINLDEFTVNAFFHNIRRDMPIYITENIIDSMGYKGTSSAKKTGILNLLNVNFGEYKNKLWWSYKNNEYEEFLNTGVKQYTDILIMEDSIIKIDNNSTLEQSVNYPPIATGRSASSIHHVLMMPIIFKELLMLCQTDSGRRVRRYYLAMVDALEIYMAYQSMLVVKQKDDKIDELIRKMDEQSKKIDGQTDRLDTLLAEQANQADVLDDMSDKLDRATEERAPKTISPKKHEKFLLLRTNEPSNRYYAIRANTTNSERSYDNIMIKHPGAQIILSFEQQPNAKNLFHHICETLGKNGTKQLNICGNYIRLTRNYTEAMMIENITEIEARKKDI